MHAVLDRGHRAVSSIVEPLCRLSLWISATCLIFLAALVFFQVISRFMGWGIVWASDLAGYTLVATTFLAMAPTLRRAVHVRVSLLIENIPARGRLFLELWSYAVGFAFAVYATRWSTIQVIESYRFGDVSIGIVAFKLWIPQISIAVGFAIFALTLLEGLLALLAGKPTAEALAESNEHHVDK